MRYEAIVTKRLMIGGVNLDPGEALPLRAVWVEVEVNGHARRFNVPEDLLDYLVVRPAETGKPKQE